MDEMFDNLSGLRNLVFLKASTSEGLENIIKKIRLPARVLYGYYDPTEKKHVICIQTMMKLNFKKELQNVSSKG